MGNFEILNLQRVMIVKSPCHEDRAEKRCHFKSKTVAPGRLVGRARKQ
jgi:hypothetical protein